MLHVAQLSPSLKGTISVRLESSVSTNESFQSGSAVISADEAIAAAPELTSTAQPGIFVRLRRLRERHKRLEASGVFLGGFCFDLLLFKRIDSQPMLVRPGAYLL